MMALTKAPASVIIFSWCAGVMYSTLFTMPYLLIAHYHSEGIVRIFYLIIEKKFQNNRKNGTIFSLQWMLVRNRRTEHKSEDLERTLLLLVAWCF